MSKLAAQGKTDGLAPSDIFSLAGLRKGDFFAHFSNVEECLGAAIELRVGGAMAAAARSAEADGGAPLRAYRVVTGFSSRVAVDRALASLCLEDGAVVASSGLRAPEWRIAALRKELNAVGFPTVGTGSGVALDASLAAMWSILRRQLSAGRRAGFAASVPVLGHLVLTPAWGAKAASEAISSASAIARSMALAATT